MSDFAFGSGFRVQRSEQSSAGVDAQSVSRLVSPFSEVLRRHLQQMLNAIFVRAFQRLD